MGSLPPSLEYMCVAITSNVLASIGMCILLNVFIKLIVSVHKQWEYHIAYEPNNEVCD
jgi:hypothetical protein